MPTGGSHISRRLGPIAALVALILALTASPALARIAYTTNFSTNTVSRIDTATNQVVGAPIPVVPEPAAIAITPDGKTALVVSESNEDMTVIDTQTNRPIATVPLGDEASMVAISPDGTTAYVVRYDSEDFVAVDLRSNQVAPPTVDFNSLVHSVAFTPDGRFAYIGDLDQSQIHVIDTRTNQVVGQPIPIGDEPLNIAFAPDGKTAFAVGPEEGNVYVIDTRTRQVIDTIPVELSDGIGLGLRGFAISPDGTRAYVTSQDSDSVYAIDLQARRVIAGPIATGGEPFDIAVTPDGRTAYVSDVGTPTVSVLDTRTNQIVTDITVPGGPFQTAIVPNQSPVASLTAKPSKSSLQVNFASTSTDPDGTASIFNWGFGDGTAAANAGPTPRHIYRKAGTFTASLTVIDNEGCSTAQVFTGRTAYCSGSALAAQAKPVTVAPNRFKFGALTRNARKGTAKLRIKVPAAGRVTLFGKGVKKVVGNIGKAGGVILIIKPKTKLKKKLARKGSAKSRVRVTFRPQVGKAHSTARSIQLIQR